MTMKSKRTITIKDPHLKKIRNNLRSLILKASSIEKLRIHDEEEELRKNDDFYDNDKFRKMSKELNDKYWSIERPLRASILLCPACFQLDKDMTYNPVLKTWYYTDCYAKLKKGYAEDGQAGQFP
ncbi:MAG: hypothetical protein ACFFBI_10490 [Promethearchaeota archaeon]